MSIIWIYSLLSILIVSLVSFVGAFTISLSRERMKGLVFGLVALSVGALFGDVFIHIIPEIYEGTEYTNAISLYILLGIVLFFVLEKFINWHHHHGCENPECTHHGIKPVGKMVLLSDGLHNFVDGLIIGASYLVSIPIGVATTIAVILHEIPQELGNFGVLLHSGYSKTKALLYNFLSALPAFLGVLLALYFNELDNLSNIVLPIAAGGFIYIAGSDLIPELQDSDKRKFAFSQLLYILLGIGLMYLLLFIE